MSIVRELLCYVVKSRLFGSDFVGGDMTVDPHNMLLAQSDVYVVVEFYLWFKFYFALFWGIVMYDNKFEKKENNLNQG